MTRDRPTKHFLITVNEFEYYDNVRRDFLDYFDGVSQYLIVVENSAHGTRHLHSYLKFAVPQKLAQVRYLINMMFDVHVEVERIKSVRNVLIYLTKEDLDALTNVDHRKLSFHYQSYKWAMENDEFNYRHPFVKYHRNNYKYLEKLHMEYQKTKIPIFRGFRFDDEVYDGWFLRCAIWLRDIVYQYEHKKRQLFLYGPSQMGKTTAIEMLVKEENMPYVFYPTQGVFAFQGLDPNFHRIIIFEEFEMKEHQCSMLKRIAEGKSLSVQTKGGADKLIKWEKPVVFISNYEPKFEEAMMNRLFILKVDMPFWLMPKVPLPPMIVTNVPITID